jgi:hypothetical protein
MQQAGRAMTKLECLKCGATVKAACNCGAAYVTAGERAVQWWLRTRALDEDAQAADLLQEYEAKIAALERMVGRQALEIEFLKGALKTRMFYARKSVKRLSATGDR